MLRRCLVAMVTWGCESCSEPSRDATPPEPPVPVAAPRLSSSSLPVAPPPDRSFRAEPSASAAAAVMSFREQSLSLVAPAPAPRRVAFGRNFLVWARTDGVKLLDSRDGRELSSTAIREPRAAVALPGGSVLVAGIERSFRFDPGRTAPVAQNRLSLLPGAELLRSYESLEFVWVAQPALRVALQYALGADAGLGVAAESTLPDHDGRSITVLRDGRLLFTAGREIIRLSASGRPHRFAVPDSLLGVFRVLPARRLDRCWLLTETGELVLFELTGKGRVVRSVRTPPGPFDIAADPERIALVSVSLPNVAPRRFALSLFDHEGELRWSVPLRTLPASLDADWAVRVMADKQVVLGETPQRVAVGGPEQLEVFDANTGARLFGSSH